MGRWLVYLGVVGLLIGARLPLALAHEGHDHKVLGTVSTIHENHLEVTDAKGKATTLTLDVQSKVRRGRTMLRVEDIKVGDRVVVTARQVKDKDGKVRLMVKDVQLGTVTTTAAKK